MTLSRGGPTLVEGPVEVVLPDGTTAVSHRFVVALCTCRRSGAYPWCDTSHRRHRPGTPGGSPREPRSARDTPEPDTPEPDTPGNHRHCHAPRELHPSQEHTR
ncbi:hypothetical protein AQ490_24720 [Wenjunlia vitaminophila]|uniref:Iron-binding zinc finger CDGSH type domain-containing protein n=1 Tax=Wenjunlia vitaminophila TaxID=76728 RepID=A0A0T6LQZ7_WENVI|nr:CDGSH iron-sulfur domain-containing protein [Wenjunlia vitaminophila]KRV48542.1 hypothetical protein AQ490_24720 [Wenjunlia vitaminophila]